MLQPKIFCDTITPASTAWLTASTVVPQRSVSSFKADQKMAAFCYWKLSANKQFEGTQRKQEQPASCVLHKEPARRTFEHLKTSCWWRSQPLPFSILAISKALTDKHWRSDSVRLALEAEFNQISVVNMMEQRYGCILAFVLRCSVVDQSCSALSVSTSLSGLHLTASGCRCFPFRAAALGAPTSLDRSSNLTAAMDEQHPVHTCVIASTYAQTHSRILLQLLQRN